MINQLKITVVCDNEAGSPCQAEHGLSFYLVADNTRLLFDTGNGSTIKHNVEALQLDLALCDFLVLSHGHYDHTGGLGYFLAQNSTAKIILHPESYVDRYSKHPNKPFRPIGMPVAIQALLHEQPNQRVIHNQGYYSLSEHIICSGDIPRQTDYEDAGGRFFFDKAQQHPDNVADDQALYIATAQGLVIILGCCHSGVENTILHTPSCYQHLPLIGLIGGFHLSNASDSRFQATLSFLRKQKLGFIYPGHCTGQNVIEQMITTLPKTQVQALYAGMRIVITD